MNTIPSAMKSEDITNYIFVDNRDCSGDVALVFGTWFAWREATKKAADLYKKGLVRKVLVSGGPNEHSGYVEGDEMALSLEDLGIPKRDILIENKAMNTLENVVFSKDILDRAIGLKDVKTIVAVVKNFHARRALMTLKKHMPPHIVLKASAYRLERQGFNRRNWHESEYGRRRVQEELEKIAKYLEKGDIAEL